MDQVAAIEKFCSTLCWLTNLVYSRNKTNEWLCTAKSRLSIAKNEAPVTLATLAGPIILEYAAQISARDEKWLLTNDFIDEFNKNKNRFKEELKNNKDISESEFKTILKLLQDEYRSMNETDRDMVWSKAKILLGSAATCKFTNLF